MAISITFDDYDTVCYSNQHNIMQLIQHSVGLSVEINLNSSAIQLIQQELPQIIQKLEELNNQINGGEPGDIAHEIAGLKGQVNALGQRIVNLEYGTAGVMDTPLWQKINDLEERVSALEG